jgi:cytidylate kinase
MFGKQLPVIAIDGTAASGKGTLARKLAEIYGMAWLDTGALYRFVALTARRKKIDFKNEAAVTELAQKIAKGLKPSHLADPEIRSDESGTGASVISAYPGVRDALLELQRRFARKPPVLADGSPAKGAVLDGRDIGTVICPKAPLKFYVTARPEIRAKRRRKELQSRGITMTYEAVLADMLKRDRRDAKRAAAPMKPAKDAIILDTSDMTIDQVLDFAAGCFQDRLKLRAL